MKLIIPILIFGSVFISAYAGTDIKTSTVEEEYRGLPYHATTTLVAPFGVTRVSAKELKKLLSSGNRLILIDVYGAIFREESLDFDGAWLVTVPRKSIPGSVWLPNVGKQKLKPVVEKYFSDQLERLTKGDRNKTIVFFCIEDCWMAWNASKRALELGYTDIMWFREGVDGWINNGWSINQSVPVNLPVND